MIYKLEEIVKGKNPRSNDRLVKGFYGEISEAKIVMMLLSKYNNSLLEVVDTRSGKAVLTNK